MVVIGITGSLCSGKETAAKNLEIVYNLLVINLKLVPSLESPSHTVQKEDPSIKSEKKLLKLIEDDSKNYLVYPITLLTDLNIFRTKSKFFIIGIDSPIQLRYRNYVKKYGKPSGQLHGFVSKDDDMRFLTNVQECLLCSDRIIQNIGSLDSFCEQLGMLDLLNFQYIRPSIDLYYIRMAELISTRSGCLQHKGGCILTNNNKIVSAGYSGIPKAKVQCVDGGCEICFDNQKKTCFCLHAEMITIIEAKINKLRGSVLYLKIFPCMPCAQSIVQARISKIVFSMSDTADMDVQHYLETCGVEVLWTSIVGI